MSSLAWTRAQRKKLHGPIHPHPLDPKDPVLGPDACWRALLDAHRSGARLRRRPAEGTTPALRDAIRQVLASYESGTPPASLELDVEMVRAAIALHDRESPDPRDGTVERVLVGLWVGMAGVAKVVELLASEPCVAAAGLYSPMNFFELTLVPPTPANAFSLRTLRWWAPLRRHVLALDPRGNEYAAARAAAEVHAKGLSQTSAGCVLAFPREHAWAADLARGWLSGISRGQVPHHFEHWAMLASLDDEALAQQLGEVAGGWNHLAAPYALDLVDVLGARAAAPLATFLEGAQAAPARRAFAAALVLADPGAARDRFERTADLHVRKALAALLR